MHLSPWRAVWTASCLLPSSLWTTTKTTGLVRAFSIRTGPIVQRPIVKRSSARVVVAGELGATNQDENVDRLDYAPTSSSASSSSSSSAFAEGMNDTGFPERINGAPQPRTTMSTTAADSSSSSSSSSAFPHGPFPNASSDHGSAAAAAAAAAASDRFETEPKQEQKKSDAAAYSVLAIDPSEIEIVTVNPDAATVATAAGAAAVVVDDDAAARTAADSNSLSHMPFVSMFRGSANYIANHRNTIAVLHIPGDLLDLPDHTVFRDLMNDVALTWLLGVKLVLVVGCRHQIEKRLGNEVSFRSHGLRVTDQDALRVVKEEAGYVRFEVERQLARSLRMQGSNSKKPSSSSAAGGYFDANVLSGNFYSAQPFGVRDGVDYKYTGFVRRVEAEKIKQALDGRDICMLTTLGVSPSGEVFNVNSESLAASVAGALSASKVIYFTEREMELRHAPSGTKIQHLRVSDARNLLKYFDLSVHRKGYVSLGSGGAAADLDRPAVHMLIKFGFAMQALEQGVKRAHVISPKHGSLLQELYTRDGSGTLISGDLYEGIRRAEVTDVAGIHELISPLIQMGTLIDRPKAALEKDIDSYYVYTRDNHIVACGQLKRFENGFAEIGCLVVNREYRSRGRGDAMLGFLERLCLLNGCTNIFVLSTQTMEWFVERGFEEVDVHRLPPSRQQTYNYNRRSKIYMKKIESPRDLDASELWWNR